MEYFIKTVSLCLYITRKLFLQLLMILIKNTLRILSNLFIFWCHLFKIDLVQAVLKDTLNCYCKCSVVNSDSSKEHYSSPPSLKYNIKIISDLSGIFSYLSLSDVGLIFLKKNMIKPYLPVLWTERFNIFKLNKLVSSLFEEFIFPCIWSGSYC